MIAIPGRIPVRVFPIFSFLVLMIGWLNTGTLLGTGIWAVVIFISILVHEYGHACTSLLFGQSAEIHLEGMGGVTLRQGRQLASWQEFIIVLSGPLAGFALFFLATAWASALGEKRSVLFYALEVAVNVNFFWTIVNLLPVLPLDGGHLLKIILESAWGFRGMRWAFFISLILGIAFGLGFFLLQQVLMGALFFMLAFESYRTWSNMQDASPEDTDIHLQNLIKEGLMELKQGQREAALTKFTFVRSQAPKGLLYVTATQYGARILAEQGHYKQAYNWLWPLSNRLSADSMRLLQQLAYRLEEWEEAVKIGQQAYQQEPALNVALVNALSYGVMGEAIPAVGWLRCAGQLGCPDIDEIVKKREFDAVRHTDAFQNWLKNHS